MTPPSPTGAAHDGGSITAAWEAAIASRGLVDDPAQRAAVARLAGLQRQLREERPAFGRRLAQWLRLPGATRAAPGPRGIYFWSPPGRGKTFLVDLFFATAGVRGRRLHFHHFMRDVHARLRRLRRRADPLRTVAEEIAREGRLLCLDELYVGDIADAMILHGLLEALIAQGVTMVITSNQPPSRLYEGGLQRERFLPAIALIERELDVVEVAGPTDYRLRNLRKAAVYLPSADPGTPARLAEIFERLAGGGGGERGRHHVEIDGRRIPVVRAAPGVAWFTFAALCEGPRGQSDYIELARSHHSLIVSDVPVMEESADDAARRFIGLVDELYDRGVKLVVSAAAEPEALYRGTRLAQAFRRTASRLVEMRTEAYLARPHRDDAQPEQSTRD